MASLRSLLLLTTIKITLLVVLVILHEKDETMGQKKKRERHGQSKADLEH